MGLEQRPYDFKTCTLNHWGKMGMEATPLYLRETYYLDIHYAKERILSSELDICPFTLLCDGGYFESF